MYAGILEFFGYNEIKDGDALRIDGSISMFSRGSS